MTRIGRGGGNGGGNERAAGSASDMDIELIKNFMINKLLIFMSTSRTLPGRRTRLLTTGYAKRLD